MRNILFSLLVLCMFAVPASANITIDDNDLDVRAELEIDEFIVINDKAKVNLLAGHRDITNINESAGYYVGVKGVVKFTGFDFRK